MKSNGIKSQVAMASGQLASAYLGPISYLTFGTFGFGEVHFDLQASSHRDGTLVLVLALLVVVVLLVALVAVTVPRVRNGVIDRARPRSRPVASCPRHAHRDEEVQPGVLDLQPYCFGIPPSEPIYLQ